MSTVVLIGSGAVGTSFLYSAMNQGLCNRYGIIDISEKSRDGNVLDLEDVIDSSTKSFSVYAADYQNLKGVDYILISAGRPQKPGETRLQMVQDNVKIISEIAQKIKDSGFNGITLICANPVDILTYAYLKITGFPKEKVIGSGTILDTARLKIEISKDIGVSTSSINGAYVIGEHGDSSVTTFSTISIGNLPLSEYKSKFTAENYEQLLEKYVSRKAYEIIERKKATYYGIGAAMAKMLRVIIEDKNEIVVSGALVSGEYGFSDLVIGVPCILGKNGIKKIVELPLNQKEKTKLQKSCEIVREIIKQSVN